MRVVIDCAGDQWRICGPDGSAALVPCPDGVVDFVAPAEITTRWARWLTDARAAGPPIANVLVLAPSVFGTARRALVAAGAAAGGARAEVVPRAHALVDACGFLYCRRALVVESRGPQVVAHVLDKVDGGWKSVAAAVADDAPTAARQLLDDTVDQAVIDGPDAVFATLLGVLGERGLWRVARADLDRIVAGLAATAPSEPQGFDDDDDAVAHEPRSTRNARPWVAAGAVAGVLGVAAGAVACLPATSGQVGVPAGDTFVQVAFDGAVVDLPQGWAVSESTPGRRIADSGDGRRVTVVRTALRAPSNRATVAAELRAAQNRRTDDRISAFAADSRVAGREVIGYRERVANGRTVDWYVVVAGTSQLSVGCERGASTAAMTGECERAVSTVRAG